MNRVEWVKSILCAMQLDFYTRAYFTTLSARPSAISTYLAKFARYLKLFTLCLMTQLQIWLIPRELGLIHSRILLDYCRRWILSRVYWGRQINWPFQFPPYTLNQPWPSKLFNSSVYSPSHSKLYTMCNPNPIQLPVSLLAFWKRKLYSKALLVLYTTMNPVIQYT